MFLDVADQEDKRVKEALSHLMRDSRLESLSRALASNDVKQLYGFTGCLGRNARRKAKKMLRKGRVGGVFKSSLE